jgi:hypothetical protein
MTFAGVRSWARISALPRAMTGAAIAAIVGVIVIGGSCAALSAGVDASDVPGVYVAKYDSGTQEITLRHDGTYVQVITVEGVHTPIVNSGTWRYGDQEVVMRNCFFLNDGTGGIRPDFEDALGVCVYPVERRWFLWGQLRLGPDEGSPLWRSY